MRRQQNERSIQKLIEKNDQIVLDNKFITQANQQLLPKQRLFQHAFQIDGSEHKKTQETQSLSQQRSVVKSEQTCYAQFLNCLGNCIAPFLITCPCVRCPSCCQNMPLFQQKMNSFGLLQRWGTYQKVLNPGLHVINPISQKVIEINRQTKSLQFKQIVFTKDNVQFQIQSVIFYRVINSFKLAYKLGIQQNQCYQCVRQIGQACLRNIVGIHTLQNVIQNRQIIGKKVKQQLNTNLKLWGIHVETCALKQIILSQQIKDYLESTAKTKRIMEAQIINYQSQVQIGKLIRDVSEILSLKSAFQIRYLQTIQTILVNNKESIIMIKTQSKDPEEKQAQKVI